MKVLQIICIMVYFVMFASACHSHRKRHKRATPAEEERTRYLRDFFSQCLKAKASNVFSSYDSIVDLSVLDVKWYENSDDLFCSSSNNEDSVSCWQERLSDYLSSTSPLLNATRECISDYSQSIRGSDPLCSIRGWTPYFNRDNPAGFGENEELIHLRNEFPGRICANPQAVEADLINKNDKHFREGGHVVRFGPNVGFRCDHIDQPDKTKCPDYKVRFCCPDRAIVCEPEEWTRFFSRDFPSGQGDFENIGDLQARYPEEVCEKPSAVDVQTVHGRDYRETNQKVSISIERGFTCRNADQTDRRCHDYKIRFCCPKVRDASHPRHINNMRLEKRRNSRVTRQATVNLNTEYESCYSETAVVDDVQQNINVETVIDFTDNHVICRNPVDCSLNVSDSEALTQYWPYKLQAILQQDSPVLQVVETCNQVVFPMEGWTPWSPWDNCPARCGEVGSQLRRRQCFNGVPGRAPCEGDLHETRLCQPENCPYWSSWGLFGECSRTCGVGLKLRHRVCTNGLAGSHGCDGPSFENANCDLEQCEDGETYGFSLWSQFDSCNAQCGETALQVRRRHCTTGAVGMPGCKGEILDSKICMSNCGSWSRWSKFSMCGDETSCGNSEHQRSRECIGGKVGNPGCYGESIQIQECYTGRSCAQSNVEIRNKSICNNWGNFSPCSVKCGRAPGVRTRSCIGQSSIPSETQQCISNVPCTSDSTPSRISWSKWGSYSSCSVSCGNRSGTRTRSRSCRRAASETCNDEHETVRCTAEIPCAIKASSTGEQGFSEWSNFDSCNAQCGQTSTHVRRRHCTTGGHGSPGCVGPIEERKTCHPEMQCGSWGEWSEFTACGGGIINCGNAAMTRSRECIGGAIGGPGCYEPGVDTRQCFTGQTC